MRAWILVVAAATWLTGCYQAHGYGDDSDAGGPFEDQGLAVEVTVMTRLGALEGVPAAGARVVVQDCDSPRQAEATTDEQGVASFDFGDVRCWTVTALLEVTWEGHLVNGAVGQLPAPVNSFTAAHVTLPSPPLPVRTGGVVVRMPSTGVYFTSGSDVFLDTAVRGTEPAGSRLIVGFVRDVAGELTETQRVFTAGYEWMNLPGTPGWSPPTSAYDSATSQHDACRVPRVSGRDVPLQDGQMLEITIPPVQVRELSGSSVSTLSVEVGGAGHRGYLSLRTAGPESLFWVIEPYDAGVFQLDALPLLPDGVADERGITARSVHVQLGVTSPGRSAFAHPDTADAAAPWWVRDGIVFGRLADFGLSDTECDEVS